MEGGSRSYQPKLVELGRTRLLCIDMEASSSQSIRPADTIGVDAPRLGLQHRCSHSPTLHGRIMHKAASRPNQIQVPLCSLAQVQPVRQLQLSNDLSS